MIVLSSGLVVARKEDGEWKFLLLRAYRNWDFPKGKVREGEDPFHAALRETTEETSLSGFYFPYSQDYKETEPYRRGTKIARYYLAITDKNSVKLRISPELGNPEHHEFRWVSYEEAKRILPPRLQPIIDWAWQKLRNFSKQD